jgi:DHA1 family multidrug resistance protein-like MFS transporter
MGQILRFITRNKILRYPEEEPDFHCPNCYKQYQDEESIPTPEIEKEELPQPSEPTIPEGRALEEVETQPEEVETPPKDVAGTPTIESDVEEAEPNTIEKIPTVASHLGSNIEAIKTHRTTTGLERVSTRSALQKSQTRADLEQLFTLASLKPGPSAPIIPTTLEDGTILVDWYTTDDPDNPQNWSMGKKFFVAFLICMYTLAVYMGSAIYAPSEGGVVEEFGVNLQLASMGLSMYVLAYGLGPMIFSPLSEVPIIGRNPPYLITYALFVILLVPTALVDNFPGLIVLRFLLGFFGSPCLATGGASLQDMFSLIKLPYVMSTWALAATCGPALGPIISGFSVTAMNWRWSQWELLWLAGPIWILMFLFLPETSPSNILLNRAKRLRKMTGDQKLKSQSEIDQANVKIGDMLKENLLRPNQMMILDPAVGFTAVYTSLGMYWYFLLLVFTSH